jgi:hypothetical protein
MKDGERKNYKRNGNAGGGVRDRGMKGIMSTERKEFPIYHRVSKCVICDFVSIFLVLLSTLKA